MGQTLFYFLRLNVEAERRNYLYERVFDQVVRCGANAGVVFDYWGSARHANNMTPRGRRLGPEACVKRITQGAKEGKFSCRTQWLEGGGASLYPRAVTPHCRVC